MPINVLTACISMVFSSMLSEEELKQLEEACDMALELNQSKHRIYEYVESRMSFIAPNLSIIVGASTAAKIMGEKCKRKPRCKCLFCSRYNHIKWTLLFLSLCGL